MTTRKSLDFASKVAIAERIVCRADLGDIPDQRSDERSNSENAPPSHKVPLPQVAPLKRHLTNSVRKALSLTARAYGAILVSEDAAA